MHLRLKWDKVLLVLIVHFARYDVSDIHYCGKNTEKRVRPAEHRMVVTDGLKRLHREASKTLLLRLLLRRE